MAGLAVEAVHVFVVLVALAGVVVLLSRRLGLADELGLLAVGLVAALTLPTQVIVTPELVLVVLLPGLVFEAAYRLRFEEFRRSLWTVGLLAVPGVIVSAAVVAVVLHVATGMSYELAFLVGAMVSATDPASVVATFQRLRSPRRLSTIVQGESLLNDGTGIVLFAAALGLARGESTLGDAALQLVIATVGAIAVGVVLGFAASRIVATIDDYLVETTISIALAYGAYVVADALALSGVIATVVAGITLGNYGQRVGMSERTRDAVDTVWGVAAFILTALVFLLIGIAIRVDALLQVIPSILWGTLAILLGRAIAVYALVRVPLAWRHVMFWSGLRGAVAVAMALSLPLDLPDRQILQETAFGIVLVTIVAQGTTAPLVIGRALRSRAGS